MLLWLQVPSFIVTMVVQFTRRQWLTLIVISIADFANAICVSLQAPFYPQEVSLYLFFNFHVPASRFHAENDTLSGNILHVENFWIFLLRYTCLVSRECVYVTKISFISLKFYRSRLFLCSIFISMCEIVHGYLMNVLNRFLRIIKFQMSYTSCYKMYIP